MENNDTWFGFEWPIAKLLFDIEKGMPIKEELEKIKILIEYEIPEQVKQLEREICNIEHIIKRNKKKGQDIKKYKEFKSRLQRYYSENKKYDEMSNTF